MAERAGRGRAVAAGVAALGLAGGLLGGPGSGVVRGQEKTARSADAPVVRALGRIEPAGGLILVGATPGRRIEALLVQEGDSVESGAEVARVEGRAQAEAALAVAEAQKAAAEKVRARKRDQLVVKREREDRLTKDLVETRQNIYNTLGNRVSRERELLRALATSATVSAQDRREAETAIDRLQVEAYQAFLALQEAKLDQELMPRLRKLEDEELADEGPEVDIFQRQVDQARAAVEATSIRAPSAGRVLQTMARAGEVSNGPILVLGDVGELVVRAEVDESSVGRVRIGDTAEIDLLGRPVPGKVSRVGRLVGINRVAPLDPRAPQDLRVLQVVIPLDDSVRASSYVNMQVDVSIKTRGGPP